MSDALPLLRVGPPHTQRIVADSRDHADWMRERAAGVTATDAARLASEHSVAAILRDKRFGGFGGNAYTDHGREREPVIAEWVRTEHDIAPSTALFHAVAERRHLATPDGVALREDGRLELAEIKTTNRYWRTIPRHYLRQVWWQQYVLGAERTLVVWEQHDDFVPVDDTPRCRWVDRDDHEIAVLCALADRLLDGLAART